MSHANLLRTVNLNLLPVLQALLREASLTGAARSLALSQPAVHAALVQLRTVLGDPLLVRVGRRMVLTPRAMALVQPVEQACEAMRRVLDVPVFDRAASRRGFVVAGSDYPSLLIGPALLHRLHQEAPGVSVHFINLGRDSFERLRQGEIDGAIAPRAVFDAIAWPREHSADLWTERFVHVVRADHPLATNASPSAEQLAAWPQAAFEPQWYPEPGPHEEFGVKQWGGENSLEENLTLRLEQFCALPMLAAASDTVVRAPMRLVERVQRLVPLHVVGSPLPAFGVALAWSAVDDDDPGHRWFRALVQDAGAGAEPDQ